MLIDKINLIIVLQLDKSKKTNIGLKDKHTPENDRLVTGCSDELLYDLHPSSATVPSEGSHER